MRNATITLTLALALVLGLSTVNAFAWNCWGNGYGSGNGYMMNGSRAYNNPQYDSFMAETQTLRTRIATERGELNALMASPNPDSQRVRQLTESISLGENQLAGMARSQNLSFGPMTSYGYGNGWNCGIVNHNHGFGSCW